jgi:hypothetical protein
MMKKRFAIAITIALLSISWGISGASATSKSPISIRFTLDTTHMKAGTTIHGTAFLTNSSSKTLMVESCALDGWLFVGLANKTIPFNPAVSAVGCLPSVKLKPGVNRFRITVWSMYQECSAHGTPRCPKSGMPGLPKGTYHTVIETLGLPRGTPTLTHLRVTVS